jgi:hypothetical protein
MSIVIKDSKYAVPIAKIKKTEDIIYIEEEPDDHVKPPERKKGKPMTCPKCKAVIPPNQSFLFHLKNSCTVKKPLEVKLQTDNQIIPLPQEMHNIIFVSGPPKSGKTYYVNQYARLFKKIYKRTVYYFTRNKTDPSLTESVYTKILTDDIDLDNPFTLECLADSLCIFDDIEDSQNPSITKYLYSLLNDIIKNGRHQNISVIFCNQEMTMHLRTKAILSQMTELVIFPAYTSKYNAKYVMDKYMGMSPTSIAYIYKIPSRWVTIRRVAPQYVLSQHMVYVIGYEDD